VLITAPHSLKLQRGGKGTPEKARMHLRERNAAEAALKLAAELNKRGIRTGFVIWNRGAGYDSRNLDPNCLWEHMHVKSPWHRALHKWASSNDEGAPLLHIDLHGKCGGKHIDIGAMPMEEVFSRKQQKNVAKFKRSLANGLEAALKERKVLSKQGNQMLAETDPELHGYWGEDTAATMSHQSTMLGIPAVQFECPPRLRKALVVDGALSRLFADAVEATYHNVVVPWWPSAPCVQGEADIEVDSVLGEDVVEVKVAQEDMEGLAGALVEKLLRLDAQHKTERQI